MPIQPERAYVQAVSSRVSRTTASISDSFGIQVAGGLIQHASSVDALLDQKVAIAVGHDGGHGDSREL